MSRLNGNPAIDDPADLLGIVALDSDSRSSAFGLIGEASQKTSLQAQGWALDESPARVSANTGHRCRKAKQKPRRNMAVMPNQNVLNWPGIEVNAVRKIDLASDSTQPR